LNKKRRNGRWKCSSSMGESRRKKGVGESERKKDTENPNCIGVLRL